MQGFLPYNAPLMMDVVIIALLFVTPGLIYGLILVHQKKYALHAKVMTALGVAVFLVVIAFEIDLRIHGGIEKILDTIGRTKAYTDGFRTLLNIHLFFAITTCIIWIITMVGAIKNFSFDNPQPNAYSKIHKTLGRLTVLDILGVATTGVAVYYFAFVAKIAA